MQWFAEVIFTLADEYEVPPDSCLQVQNEVND